MAEELLIHQHQGRAALPQPEVPFRKPILPGKPGPKGTGGAGGVYLPQA